jgi:hypothetical protein
MELIAPTIRNGQRSPAIRGGYAALGVFLLAAFGCDLASAFFFAAQYAFILAACCFLWAAVNPRRFFFAGAGAAAEVVTPSGFLGGRPRRFVGPLRASIALLSLSRSAISRLRMCSVGIHSIVA